MKIMAVDLGDTRTGIATCDKHELLASPLTVIHEKDPDKRLDKIILLVQEHKIEQLVIGYPKNMNNSVGERAEKSEAFVAAFKESSSLPITLWDERGTTVAATGYLNTTNTRGKKRKNVIDAVAATIILESYLDWRKNNKGQV